MTVTIVLPYDRPPLTPNDRPNRYEKSRLTREIRHAAHVLAKSAKLPSLRESAVTATCTWFVPDRRKRDVGSLTLTAKAAIDGLVDAGILAADDWTVVTEERYRIRLDPQHPRIELTLEETP
ncbi:RusA-like resolvase [Gordonia phage Clark]|uniref:RusA-like resolvase n=4 Tax=Beenievirus TaxID=3044673 RepID=A0A4Y6EH25_9CAUD|nr:RusA-like Holliday junction resolvase [Gordonia phage Beenie]YP_010654464.1 RusA-like Holliday junction resolvase [Gordonia phage Clark]YP_010654544.1 RusA-like Holliday junction resolvase [Gordonia phage Samman98]YP_010654623.1 RusA-like Holliday junction resolvase [Gordonia phage MichaelScott]AUV61629.1 hypothetical protein PBI_BEENIE_64 [Gordonia phage Beenie]QDF18018.1 RusA-like resolvase [Gordonia phage Clark]QOC56313.1 RusA-like resolvase [Gordonia phage MichaelScott]QYC54549.1 RusA